MTPQALADLHAMCLSVPRPYSAQEFTELLAARSVFLCTHRFGFALGRTAADEAELLTLAVHPDRRRTGIGRGLLGSFEARAQERGARMAFLEVAANNPAASGLYLAAGFAESGRRRNYYVQPGSPAIDAIIMRKVLSAD